MGDSGAPEKTGDMSEEAAKANKAGKRNLAEQGRQGNIKQNTTNKGYTQDR